MSKQPLISTSGKYQWNAKVRGARRTSHGHPVGPETVNITVFSDSREDAARDAVNEIAKLGYTGCTLNHITKHGNRQ